MDWRKFWNRDTKIKTVTLIITVLLVIVTIKFIDTEGLRNTEKNISYYHGKAIEIIEDNVEEDEKTEGVLRGSQKVKVEITSGEHKGEVAVLDNYISALYNVYAKEGTPLIIRASKDTSGVTYTIYNYDRTVLIYSVILLFAILLCVIGGRKGFAALLSLIVMLIGIFFVLLPLYIKGYPAVTVTLVMIVAMTLIGYILIDSINKKTVSACLGTIAGVMVSGLLAYFVGLFGHLTGFQTQEAETLLLIAGDDGLKVKNLLVCGILIASLGAVMDVAMSIASSIHELHEVNPTLSSKQLFLSGMNIGKDAMGTMANTLILAFTGASLNLLLLIYSYGIPYTQLMNTDLIAIEIMKGIAGSVGIILTVPIVAFISANIEVTVRQ
ncbi:YibE/F family protein [Velocimicrobium porci]|uniref:YibE/F family protein n=1 Tax=Velocimicrobium porci TaxID=2606634 RepID=A0A6L5XUE4_9FIRM|nr:YibE/F family protein [Velocimicrobium porci]MSS62385.1 YibE/F family protein [Velocimicrobium porci]